MTKPRVTFVVPSLTPIPEARLRRRLKLGKGGDFEIINAYGDRSAAANRNAGIKRARGNTIVFVDEDVEAVLPNWWPPLVDALERRQQIVCCAPLLWIPGKGAKQWGEGRPSATLEAGWAPKYWYLPRYADHISTAVLACRTRDAREAMFDEDYLGAGFEDVDFSLRLRRLRRNAEGLVLCTVICIHHSWNQGRVDSLGRNIEPMNYRLLWKKWPAILRRNQISPATNSPDERPPPGGSEA